MLDTCTIRNNTNNDYLITALLLVSLPRVTIYNSKNDLILSISLNS